MEAVLAARLAACDVDVVATNAALLGLDVERLTVEATGSFDLRSYLGFDGARARASTRSPTLST